MVRVFTKKECFEMTVNLLHLLTLYVFIHPPECVLHTVIIDVTCFFFRIAFRDVPSFPAFICLNGNLKCENNMIQHEK